MDDFDNQNLNEAPPGKKGRGRKNRPESENPASGGSSMSKSGANSSKYNYIIQHKKVRTHARQKKIVTALGVFIVIMAVVGGGLYGLLTMVEYNNFKIVIDRPGANIFSLSDSYTFSNPTEVLEVAGPKYMDNTSLMDFDFRLTEIAESDGILSGDKYIASTFYLKNITSEEQTYKEVIELEDYTRELHLAIRVMLIKEYEMTVFAYPDKNGNPEKVVPLMVGEYTKKQLTLSNGKRVLTDTGEPWFTQPFYNDQFILYNTGLKLGAGQTVKYSLLVWLEGNDEECVDERLGGIIRLNLSFAQT